MTVSAQSEVGAIRRLVLKHARDAFVSDELIAQQWEGLGYRGPPDVARAVEEYDRLVETLSELGVEPEFLPRDDAVGLDSIYVRDASVVSDRGAVLCNMGKEARRAEPAAQGAAFEALGIPVLGAISGDGTLEGGDAIWLDERTLVVGRGYRTNDEGIDQLGALLDDAIDELIVVPLPHWHGPGDVFHLMSILSPIDRDLLLVYAPLLPVPFREELVARGFDLVEVPDDEFANMACNVLAVAPRRCVMLRGNPRTRALLERAGAEVREVEGREISWKGSGGPTCLTRPIEREG
jgi:N-dimethylarginine dimethylaminohydrolase